MRSAAGFNCVQCGAPLALSGTRLVVCRYCHREQHIPLRTELPRREVPAPVPARHGNGAARLLWLAFAVLVFGAAAVAFVFQRILSSPSPAHESKIQPPADAPSRANAIGCWSAPAELVRVSGNDLDVVGVTQQSLVAIDGATGELLWRVPMFHAGNSAYADGGDRLVLATAVNGLERRDPKTGKELWKLALTGGAHSPEWGLGCARFSLGSRQLEIDTGTGVERACPDAKAALNIHEQTPSFALGDLQISVSLAGPTSAVNPGIPQIAVRANRGGKNVWTSQVALDPVWESGAHRPYAVPVSGGVFLLGRDAKRNARRLLIDAASGRTLYAQASDTRLERLSSVTSSGDMVYAVHDCRLDAFRAATGELAFTVGR